MSEILSFDPIKRERTLEERGLDFADAVQVFSGATFTMADDRFPYQEPRFISVGMLAVVWWLSYGRPSIPVGVLSA